MKFVIRWNLRLKIFLHKKYASKMNIVDKLQIYENAENQTHTHI